MQRREVRSADQSSRRGVRLARRKEEAAKPAVTDATQPREVRSVDQFSRRGVRLARRKEEAARPAVTDEATQPREARDVDQFSGRGVRLARRKEEAARPAVTDEATQSRRTSRPENLGFALFGDVVRREGGPFAEEEIFHVFRHEILGLLLPRHQAILIENHLHAFFPELPGLNGDVLENALAQFARPGWRVQARELFLEFHALHCAGCCRLAHDDWLVCAELVES
jgi:hypothetical protein